MSDKIKFTIYSPPFSINSAYYLKSYGGKGATKIRTKECREWGDAILLQLKPKMEEMLKFKALFNEKEDALVIHLKFHMPKSKLYNKGGGISAASCDITNIEKLLVDILFDARFNGRTVDSQRISNLDINDKYVVRMLSEKVPSSREYMIEITVEKVSNTLYHLL